MPVDPCGTIERPLFFNGLLDVPQVPVFPVDQDLCPGSNGVNRIATCEDVATCRSIVPTTQIFAHMAGFSAGTWLREDVSHSLPWFKQGGTRWLTAEELAKWGAQEMSQSMPVAGGY